MSLGPTDTQTAPRPRTISVLCVTRNRKALLRRCLQSCTEQRDPPVEIVVVDNASDDQSAEMLAAEFPSVRCIRMHRNIGFFPALNIAIANSRGTYVMTVDDDSYFLDEHALGNMVAAFEGDQSVGVVTCNIEGPAEAPLASSDRYVHTFKTGFAMIRREVFEDWVGYYPDLFFRSAGESYVSSALWDSGRSVRLLSEVRMYHDMAMQGRSTWHWGYHGLRSQILLVFMRSPWWLIAPALMAKCLNGFYHFARRRRLKEWAAAWLFVWASVPAALKYRRPIRWKTQQLLWRLRSPMRTITDVGITDSLKLSCHHSRATAASSIHK